MQLHASGFIPAASRSSRKFTPPQIWCEYQPPVQSSVAWISENSVPRPPFSRSRSVNEVDAPSTSVILRRHWAMSTSDGLSLIHDVVGKMLPSYECRSCDPVKRRSAPGVGIARMTFSLTTHAAVPAARIEPNRKTSRLSAL